MEAPDQGAVLERQINNGVDVSPEDTPLQDLFGFHACRDRTNTPIVKKAVRRSKDHLVGDTMEFPSIMSDDLQKQCVSEYREALSSKNIKGRVCAVCGEEGLNVHVCPINALPGKDMLSQQNCQTVLPEYRHHGLVLVSAGICDDQINCCKECFTYMQKGKLPPCSLVNGLQVGSSPNILQCLTIPERMLISTFRTKMYVLKLSQIAGPGSNQYAIKGNSITFPQNVASVASNLPNGLQTLPENMKVVFIGNTKPTKQQLSKLLRVRRTYIHSALRFLQEHHPQYQNIQVDHHELDHIPENDIPENLWDSIIYSTDGSMLNTSDSGYSQETVDEIILNDNSTKDNSDVLVQPTGIIDVDGTSVSMSNQMQAAAQRLCDPTLVIPHGAKPAVEYSNPQMWLVCSFLRHFLLK